MSPDPPRPDRPSTTADVVIVAIAAIRPGVLVMGTLAPAGLRGRFIGNTAEGVLDDVESSLLAVKPDGFESPV